MKKFVTICRMEGGWELCIFEHGGRLVETHGPFTFLEILQELIAIGQRKEL
jgi:hypothetical protein